MNIWILLLPIRRCTANFNIQESCSRVAGRQAILPPVASAKFRSKKSFNFRYGQVVIRAKLPKGDWLLPRELNKFLVFFVWILKLRFLSFFFRPSFGANDKCVQSDQSIGQWCRQNRFRAWKFPIEITGRCRNWRCCCSKWFSVLPGEHSTKSIHGCE